MYYSSHFLSINFAIFFVVSRNFSDSLFWNTKVVTSTNHFIRQKRWRAKRIFRIGIFSWKKYHIKHSGARSQDESRFVKEKITKKVRKCGSRSFPPRVYDHNPRFLRINLEKIKPVSRFVFENPCMYIVYRQYSNVHCVTNTRGWFNLKSWNKDGCVPVRFRHVMFKFETRGRKKYICRSFSTR